MFKFFAATLLGAFAFGAETEEFLEIERKVISYGYTIDQHEVLTSDGFILQLIRLGKLNHQTSQVALLQHGLAMRAEHWITWFGGSWALPLQMVDQGFDVWLGNNRGNRSGRHQYLSPEYNPQSYWDYSFAEMGTLDLPAMVQFILKVTSVEKLTYIGYSQGTTQMFYSLARMEDFFFADRIDKFIALAPCTKVKPWISDYPEWQAKLVKASVYAIESTIKSEDAQAQIDEIVNFFGLTTDNEAATVKAISHYLQIGNSQRFQEYSTNFYYRGRTTPEIELEKISKVPIYLFAGEADQVCDLEQSKWTASQLKTIQGFFSYPEYAHIDFFMQTSYYHDLFGVLLGGRQNKEL